MDKIVKLLAVNTGSEEIVTEKHEFPSSESEKIKETILESLNRMGKSSHVLISYSGKLYTANHTSQRGKSRDYYRAEVRYHPMATELA